MLAILEKDHRFIDAYKAIGKDQEMCRYIDELQEEGRKEGIKIGEAKELELYNQLIGFMAKDNRINELIEAATTPQAVNNLFKEYKLI